MIYNKLLAMVLWTIHWYQKSIPYKMRLKNSNNRTKSRQFNKQKQSKVKLLQSISHWEKQNYKLTVKMYLELLMNYYPSSSKTSAWIQSLFP